MAAIQKQVPLPLSRAAQIAMKSLRARLGRSVLTIITIIMAIAFLTFIWLTRAAEPLLLATLPEAVTPRPAAGSTARTVWLLALSMLVCLVGISNAILMSVMERFREIGTMKCLGALDSFILKLYFLESLFLGATGAVAGAMLGILLAVVQLGRRFGGAAWSHIPWGMAAIIGVASVAIGLVITAAAAMYPALRAARMEPIAAMRVEV